MEGSIKLNICKHVIGDKIYMGVAAGGMLDVIRTARVVRIRFVLDVNPVVY